MTTWSGLGCGVALLLVSFWAEGGGHGTMLPMFVSSAPFGLAGIDAAFSGIALFWTAIGLAWDFLPSAANRTVVRLMLLTHYVSAIWLLVNPPDAVAGFLSERLFLWPALVVWVPVYAWIQFIAWRPCGTSPRRLTCTTSRARACVRLERLDHLDHVMRDREHCQFQPV